MSATACVSAAEPDRQHHIVSCTCVNLSVTRLAIYAPVVVRESAPSMTPSRKVIAILFGGVSGHDRGKEKGGGGRTLRFLSCRTGLVGELKIVGFRRAHFTSPVFRWFISTCIPSVNRVSSYCRHWKRIYVPSPSMPEERTIVTDYSKCYEGSKLESGCLSEAERLVCD